MRTLKAKSIQVGEWLLGQIRTAQKEGGSNEASGRRRELESDLKATFTRMGLDRMGTSFGERLRIELLPDNRRFQADVYEARRWLGITDGLFAVTDEVRRAVEARRSREREGLTKVGALDTEVIPYSDSEMRQDQLATWFSVYNRQDLLIERFPDIEPFRALRESAREAATAYERAETRPKWLSESSSGNHEDPLAETALALCGIHSLPERVKPAIKMFLLTGDRLDIEELPVFDIRVEPEFEDGVINSFKINASGIDEYTSIEELVIPFAREARNAVNSLARERGLQKAQRPRVTSKDYRDVMKVYDLVETEGISVEQAVLRLGFPTEELRTFERQVRDLKSLFSDDGPIKE